MYVLFPRDPDRCQIGQTWRMPNEHAIVRDDKYIVCQKETTAKYLGRKGWLQVDIIDLKDVSKELKMPRPVLNRWAAAGKIALFESGERSYMPKSQFDQIKSDKESKDKNA